MNKITDIFKTYKYAIIWTIAYTLVVYCVLLGLFNFDMLSKRQWIILLHAKLIGFPGFVFGILMLAAVPMYIATTMLIIRTQKPLFTIPVPNCFKKSEPQKDSKTETESDIKSEPQPTEKPLPSNMPQELQMAFVRARQSNLFNATTKTIPIQNQPTDPTKNTDISEQMTEQKTNENAVVPTEPEPVPDGELPLPDDFDIPTDFDNFDDVTMDDTSNITTPNFADVPLFNDIHFEDVPNDAPTPDFTETDKKNESDLIKYLTDKNQKFDIQNNLIVTNDMAIATHDDNDLWITDDTDWFAAGKQKTSPTNELMDFCSDKKDITPVLYLKSTNIMGIDELIPKWAESGIRIITDPSEL